MKITMEDPDPAELDNLAVFAVYALSAAAIFALGLMTGLSI